ncbi:endonuclease [Pseudoalteromonas rubra]|uniref:Endonuclease n=1 Tax=Pseudoalteromonas rubra TaxID=43658 RepID=A0A5S3WFT1_9GAMM|nr:endonuclease/exonuclease/phosphatase family protein [Pseudoalteromonas rubra]TMP24633.1 endonuclease [Pseudoalteromonas rubra]TMP36294.1 endonuclease [Pseudoalteromonas rubra]
MELTTLSKGIAKKLKLLVERIEQSDIPPSMLDETLNIATWNIRDFGKRPRSDLAISLIARILYQFDLIAITELRDDLTDFKRVMRLLGPDWQFVISDWQSDFGGNWERTAFVFDKRMVQFTGLAAEAQPDRQKVSGQYISEQSWWRAPYMASFKAGNFDFMMLAMHARWGTRPGREQELASFAEWIKSRWVDNADTVFDEDLIVVGDFNIPRIGDRFYQALTHSSGLQMPLALADIHDTAASAGNKRYDQILHRARQAFSYADKGGVIDFAADGLMAALFDDSGIPKSKWTYELSDHFPLWVQINTNNELAILNSIIQSE